jgi:hypothetical protein
VSAWADGRGHLLTGTAVMAEAPRTESTYQLRPGDRVALSRRLAVARRRRHPDGRPGLARQFHRLGGDPVILAGRYQGGAPRITAG